MSAEIIFSAQRYRICQSFNVELLGIKLECYSCGSVFIATCRSADVNQTGYFFLCYTDAVCHAHSLIPWEILNLPCLPITETVYRFRVNTVGSLPDRQACRSTLDRPGESERALVLIMLLISATVTLGTKETIYGNTDWNNTEECIVCLQEL